MLTTAIVQSSELVLSEDDPAEASSLLSLYSSASSLSSSDELELLELLELLSEASSSLSDEDPLLLSLSLPDSLPKKLASVGRGLAQGVSTRG